MTRPRRPSQSKTRTPMASRIQALRLSRGLTQVELSVEAGVSRSHIAKIETGDDSPGISALQALAAFFNVSMDYLQTGIHPAPTPTAGRFVDDAEQLAILDLWQAIPPGPDRRRVARMIQAAAEDNFSADIQDTLTPKRG